MQIDDPFTAVALKGVMEALMDFGTVIVCTSNSSPYDLNRHGVHEDLFSQFTERLLKACTPVELSANEDYRLAFATQVCPTEALDCCLVVQRPANALRLPLGEKAASLQNTWHVWWAAEWARGVVTQQELPVSPWTVHLAAG